MKDKLIAIFPIAIAFLGIGAADAQLLPRDLDQTTTDVYHLPRPDYAPPEIAIGGAVLSSTIPSSLLSTGSLPLESPTWPPLTTPVITETATYDNNIYTRNAHQQADMINTTTEALNAEWDRQNDFVLGGLYAAQQIYASHPSEDADAYEAHAAARIETGPKWYVQLVGYYAQQPQIRGAPEASTDQAVRPIYDNPYGLISIAHDGTQLTEELQYQIQEIHYLDSADDNRDLAQRTISGNILYHPTDFETLVLTPSYQMTDWKVMPQTFNSTQLGIAGGLRYEIPTLFKGYVLIGIQKQHFENPLFHDLTEPTLDGMFLWNVLPLTSIVFSAGRTVSPSVTNCRNACTVPHSGGENESVSLTGGSNVYITTSATIGIQHEVWHDLLVEEKFGWQLNRFKPLSPNLIQNSYQLVMNVRYLVNRYSELDFNYVYNDRVANFPFIFLYNTGPYTESVLSITLNVGF